VAVNKVPYRSTEEKMNIGSNKLMGKCKKSNDSNISGVYSRSIDVSSSSSSIIGNCNDVL
jgi:hypothetical protein